MSFNRDAVYNTVSEDLDKKAINKRDKVIEGIKGNLYDVLTLGGDNFNTEACDKIIDNLNQKLEKAKNAEYPKESYIKNLEFLIKDAENRKEKGVGQGVENKNKPYMDLDFGGGFDQKVLNTVADNIAELAKDSDQIDDILIKKLIGDEKYKEELKVKLMGKKDSMLLNETQKKNLQSIIDSFDSNKQNEEVQEETETAPETAPETTPETTPETAPETTPETTPEIAPETTPETAPETTPETAPETTPETAPETTPETTPEAAPETAPETAPEIAPEQNKETQKQPEKKSEGIVTKIKKRLKKIGTSKKAPEASSVRSTEISKETRAKLRQLERENKDLTEQNTDLLEKIKKAPSSTEVAELKKQIQALQKDKKALIDRYEKKLPEFGGDITKLKTKMLEVNFLEKKKEGGQTKLRIGPEIAIRHNILSRHRINSTINKLNDLGKELGPDKKNPDAKGVKKGVNYILNKSFLLHGGAISSAFKATRNIFKIRTIPEFDDAFGKQKKLILEDLKAKMDKNTTSKEDDETIKAVSNRLDYYQAAYKKTFIRV